MYEDVGIGNRPAALVAQQIARIADKSTKTDMADTSVMPPLLIKGTEGLVMRYALCCRPIPGDSIAGLIDVGYGIEVHLLSCSHIIPYHEDAERYVTLSWEAQTEGDF